MPDRNSRREFLRRSALCGASALGAGLWVACDDAEELAALAEEARRLGANLDCSDTTGLLEAERLTRETNAYVEASSRPGEYCFTCENYQAPAEPGTCATCKTVKGPINPGGWCKSWTRARR